VVWERDRQPTITVQADVQHNAQGIDVTNRSTRRWLPAQQLPVGYRVEIGGSVEENAKAQGSINAQMPLLVVAVLVLLMVQLQSFSRVLMVVLTAPLGLIGVVMALLLFHKPFGFVAMLGTIAMFGIIMRNSVILVDQIEQDILAGHSRFEAIVGATVRRFRPITLTAAAAVLALIPLLRSNFFGPMATALMGGITVATVLTLVYLPALYALWFRQQATLTERSYVLGAASHEDVLTIQQQAASIDTSIPPVRSQALRARHALAVLMGRTPDQAPSNLALAELHLPTDIPVSVPSDLLQQRPDVLAAEASVHAASAQVGIATANLFPHISLSASLGSAAFKPANLFTAAGSIWSAGVSITQPIFHGGALMAQRRASIANYNVA
jgi:predicted RND superfamily exporter protein